MARPRLGDQPMTAAERAARRRQREAAERAEVSALRAEIARLRSALADLVGQVEQAMPGEDRFRRSPSVQQALDRANAVLGSAK